MQDLKAHWPRIQVVLDELFELPEGDRGAYLSKVCAGDPELLNAVKALWQAYDDAPPMLDGNAAQLARSLLCAGETEAEAPDYRGRRVGPYRLIAEVGRGGMGVVYRAERADEAFEQEVAIKLLLATWRDKEMLRDRFHQEQQVLAALHHPNIAQLYDGGVTEDGQPYIVMEYIRGEPLTDYCDKQRLGIAERLSFVSQITEALHYAHKNLIVHRDIKPSNILVTNEGQIKLLDFGIAKLVGEDVSASNLTQTGEQLLTPGFAAPEQIRGRGITVATDIYQLGVVLYKLLTGHAPFRQEASFYEMACVVCEQTPIRPSAVLTRQAGDESGESAEEIASRRGLRLSQLRKKLSGDLDAIVLKALRKEPEARYSSMAGLNVDLRRYEEGRPVAARKQSLRYQTGKFVRRHWWGVAASAVFAALLVGYAVTVTIQAKQIQSALDQTEIEARKAQEVSEFLTGIFKVVDPNVSGGETVTAKELLDKGKERLSSELEQAPEIRAQMLHVLGEIYYSLGSYEQSASLLESALDIRRELLATDSGELVSTITNLAFAYNSTDKYDRAQQLLEEALSIHRRSTAESLELAEILNALGEVQRMRTQYGEALGLYQEAIAMLRRVTKGHHSEMVSALNNLATLYISIGDFAKAEANSREAVEIAEEVFGVDHSYFTITLNNLGFILRELESHEEAQSLHLRALQIQERILGTEHPYLVYTLRFLGAIALQTGQLIQAEEYYRRALSMQSAISGEKSAAFAATLRDLAKVLARRGDYAEAESLYATMLELDKNIFAADSTRIGRDLVEIASLALAKGELSRAKHGYDKALAILPANGTSAATAHLGYARILFELNELKTAEQHARAALETREPKFPANHSSIAEAQSALGVILLELRRVEEAARLLTIADEVLQARFSADAFAQERRDALEEIARRP